MSGKPMEYTLNGEGKVVSLRQAAKLMRLPYHYVYRAAQADVIPVVMRGTRLLVRKSDFEQIKKALSPTEGDKR